MPTREQVGERLRSLRGKRTLAEEANALGVTPMAISQWENGKRMPNDEMKTKIARHFGVTVTSIFFD